MIQRLLALLLSLVMVFSLFGCTKAPAETPTTEPAQTTLPPETEPPAEELYAQARSAIDEAENLELAVTMTKTRSIGGEAYTETATQTIVLQGLGTESLKASLTDTTFSGEDSCTSLEFYDQGQVWLLFNESPFTSEITQEDYLSRLVPAVLVDASLYGEVTAQAEGSSTQLTFSQPTAGESWAVPEYAELLSASGTAVIDGNGVLTQTGYTVSYVQGPTQVDLEVTVAVSVPVSPELGNDLGVAETDYISLEYIDVPALLFRAVSDVAQAQNISYTSIDTMITYAGGAIFSQQENLDLYGSMMNYELDISLQDYSGEIDSYELKENLQGKVLKYTEDGSNPTSRLMTDAQAAQLVEENRAIICDYIWSAGDLTSATITDMGSVYLLEFTGSEALGDVYEGVAVASFWGDENFLRDLADSYRTDKLEGYLSIDKYTELPVSSGFTFEGVHTVDGQEYLLSDQWDQTMFLGSNTAYEAITEEPLPDEGPETMATPLFYHVTGENGQEMWLMGTIHVGDDRTGYLPQEIYDALENADALAVEFDSDAFDDAIEEDDTLLEQIQDAYFYSDGSQTKDHLDEETYEYAVKLLKATGNYYMNAEYLKPYLWSQSIENFYLQQGYGLVSEKGVDNRLMEFAREKEIPIRDIESGLFQIQMLCGYSDELQQLLLEDSLGTDSAEYCASVADLYEKWCAGDEAVLREELSSEVDTSEFTEEELAEYEAQLPYIEEYNKAMSYDRNEGMLQTAIEYLESGDTIFYAVGLAHLLDGTNGLVDALREAGYTVELVRYQ